MNTLVHEVATASPYGADPLGTTRPASDFRSKDNPEKVLFGYGIKRQDPLVALLGLPEFNDERDEVVGDRELAITFIAVADGEPAPSKETWVAFWDQDNNDPDVEGVIDTENLTVIRIA